MTAQSTIRSGWVDEWRSVKKIGLFPNDEIPKWLILKPAYPSVADLFLRHHSAVMRNKDGFTRMGRCHYIGPCHMQSLVNREFGLAHWVLAFHHLALLIHQNEI